MKNPDAREFSQLADAALSFKSLTAAQINSALLPFYLGLDSIARRERFGGAMSDDAIRRHCDRLDPDHAVVLACASSSGLVAAIELHPLAGDWEDCELALADRAGTDRVTVIAHLLQLAAFAAGERGCRAFIMPGGSADWRLRELLRGMGRLSMTVDTVRVEIGEYARPVNRSSMRP